MPLTARVAGIDRYAQRHPHLFARWRCPSGLAAFVESGAGVFLDIGAGDGTKLRALISGGLLSGYGRVIGADLSPTRLKTMAEHVDGIEALLADAQSLPLEAGSVDFVFSDQVIEHVPDDHRMAHEIARVLRPGGRAYVGSVLKLPGAWYFYRNGGRWRIDPTHVREYESEDSYRAIFEHAGLTVLRLEHSPMAFPLADLAIRALLLMGVVRRSRALDAYGEFPILAHLRDTLSIAIPRYRIIAAYVNKPLERSRAVREWL